MGTEIERRFGSKGLTVRPVKSRPNGATPGVGRLVGYAAVFNSDSSPMRLQGGLMVERVAPGAFRQSLEKSPDVVFLWGHDDTRPLAKAPRTLRIHEDSNGLRIDADLPDTSDGRDLRQLVNAGVIDAMSFGFIVRRERTEKRTGKLPIRWILEAEVIEVSAVTFPAYPGTSLALSSPEKPLDEDHDAIDRDRRLRILELDYWESRLRYKRQ